MPAKKSNRTFLTLFTTLILAAAVVQAYEVHSPLQYRQHNNMKRFIRKRAPIPQLTGTGIIVEGAIPTPSLEGEGEAQESTTSAAATSRSTSTSRPASTSRSTSTSSATTSSSTTAISSLPTTSGTTTSATSSSASTSTSSSTTTRVSSTATAIVTEDSGPAATELPAPEATSEAINVTGAPAPTGPKNIAVVTQTEDVDAPAETTGAGPSGASKQGNAVKEKSSAPLIAIMVIVASIGGIAILWTVFRKWKLGQSAKFEKRLQPLDWQPDARDGDTRADSGSLHRHGSGGSELGHGGRLQPVPDHDFTAGSTAVGGYADLARGPSPSPQMQDLRRGPSVTSGGYNTTVPLHHQTGYGNTSGYRY